MFCPNCGTYNYDNAQVCASCGTQMAPPAAYPPPQMPYPVQPVYGYAPPAPAVPAKAQSITGMILGIVSLCLFCVWYLSIPCGVVGIVFSVIARRKSAEVGYKNNMANAGFICSCIGLGLGIVFVIVSIAIISSAYSSAGRYF